MQGFSLAATFLLTAAASTAQWTPPAVAITHVEGDVYAGSQQVLKADFVVKESAVVRTEKGRAEIRFDRGDRMFLGENSSVRVQGAIEILTGSVVVISGEVGPALTCRGTVHLSDAGIFRFDVHRVLDENFCKVRVYKGAAGAQMPSFVWILTPGKMVDLGSCGDHTPRDEFKVEETDAFDLWSGQRAGARP
jgi:hypothetical protein